MAALAERITPELHLIGFGPARFQPAGKYIPIRWPTDLWFRRYTQNDDLHIFVYDDRIALRVHIDAFHGDRPRNNAALDLVREAIETDLHTRLPTHLGLNWRAAQGGNNQVCAVSRTSGISSSDVDRDAKWVAAAARAWLEALLLHPIPRLRERVEAQLGST
jgi:hypothetical protein